MAKVLKKIFIPTTDEVVQNFPIESWHVSQSVDAFTGIDAYDITLSGSLVITGSVAINGLTNPIQNSVLTYDTVTGLVYYTSSATFAVNNFYTSSVTQSITSSVVNNTINNSTINQTIISSSVNNVAPSDKFIQYNSGSTFGADSNLVWNYNIQSLKQGFNTAATGLYAHSEGLTTVASGDASHAEGRDTLSSGPASHTEGYLATASGISSHAEGLSTQASGDYSHAEGSQTVAKGIGSHAEGSKTSASIDYAHAEGFQTRATGWFSHAEGYSTLASASGSHAEGTTTQATGDYAHSEGGGTYAQAAFSHTEGYGTISTGIGGHAEGLTTVARGQYSHAEGFNTTAIGSYSHAEGYYATSSNNASYAHAEGWGTVADGNYQHVMGAFNRSSSNASAFIVGNGTSAASRSNLIYASGSLVQITGSTNITSTLTTSGSRVRRYRTLTLTNADYNTSPTPSIQSDDDILLIIDNTTSVAVVGEGNLSITNFLNSSAGRCVEIVKIKDGTGGGIIILNAAMSGNTLNLNNINESNGTRTICSSLGNSITLMSMGIASTGSAWGNGY